MCAVNGHTMNMYFGWAWIWNTFRSNWHAHHLIVSHIFAVHSASAKQRNRNEWKETGIHIVLKGRKCEKNGCFRLFVSPAFCIFLAVRRFVTIRQIVPKAPANSFRKRIARGVRLSSRRRIDAMAVRRYRSAARTEREEWQGDNRNRELTILLLNKMPLFSYRLLSCGNLICTKIYLQKKKLFIKCESSLHRFNRLCAETAQFTQTVLPVVSFPFSGARMLDQSASCAQLKCVRSQASRRCQRRRRRRSA